MIVPELLFLEVINVLIFKVFDKELLKKANNDLFGMQLYVEKLNNSLLSKAISLAVGYNLTIYGSLYGAISQLHSCPLITEDEKLKNFPSAVGL